MSNTSQLRRCLKGRQHHLLILTDAYPSSIWPAANPFVRSQALALQELGWQVSVFVPTPYVPIWLAGNARAGRLARLPSCEVVDGILVWRPRFPRPPGAQFRKYSGPMQRWSLRNVFQRVVEEIRPDIVHAHMATPTGYAGIKWAIEAGLASCVTVHGLDITAYPNTNTELYNQTIWTLSNASRVIAASHYLSGVARELLQSDRNLRVCHTGVDTRRFLPCPEGRRKIRKELGIPEDMPVVGFAGRMVEGKGIDDFVSTIQDIERRGHDVVTLLVGDGLDRRGFLGGLEHAIDAARVKYVGEAAHDDMPAFLSCMDLLFHPSRSEGFGMVLLEAQSCGLPVVAKNVGGIPEAVDAGRSARLVACESEPDAQAKMFADAIIELLSDRREMSQMGTAGRQLTTTKFGILKCTRALVEIYEEL